MWVMGYGILRPQLVVWVCVVRLRRHGLLHGFSGGAAARVSTMSLTRYGLMEVWSSLWLVAAGCMFWLARELGGLRYFSMFALEALRRD